MFSLRDASVHLNGLITQIAQYPVLFRQDAKLAECVAAAVYILEAGDPGGGMPLKPMAVSGTVWRFTGKPLNVWFEGGCPSTLGVGSCGMHFVDMDGRPFYTRGRTQAGLYQYSRGVLGAP